VISSIIPANTFYPSPPPENIRKTANAAWTPAHI